MNWFDRLGADLFARKIRGHVPVERLSSYIDGRLSPGERLSVEVHMQACARCRQEVEGLRTTVALLRRVPSVQVPRPFTLREAPVPPGAGLSPRPDIIGIHPLTTASEIC